MNYYNENDKHAAKWLRNLIAGGMIPPGDVDERSIEDVRPNDLRGYTQCHFFAGIGGWSEALRLANWSSDRTVWTGSCPCQSFSSAGKRKGTDDKRHLWPVWFELIKDRKPSVIFGEQVDAAIRHGWLDLVSDDLGKEGYELGAAVLPACSVGAPHIRKRLFFMAYAHRGAGGRDTGAILSKEVKSQWRELQDGNRFGDGCTDGCMAYGDSARQWECVSGIQQNIMGYGQVDVWSNSEWIYCGDGKYRPIEPGTLPLADGVPSRVVKIRGYGNAIVPQVAAEVIKAGIEYLKEVQHG